MSYRFEWISGAVGLGTLLILLLVPGLALIALLMVALAAVAAAIALVGAVLALPFVLVRVIRSHFAERHEPAEAPAPMAPAIARAAVNH